MGCTVCKASARSGEGSASSFGKTLTKFHSQHRSSVAFTHLYSRAGIGRSRRRSEVIHATCSEREQQHGPDFIGLDCIALYSALIVPNLIGIATLVTAGLDALTSRERSCLCLGCTSSSSVHHASHATTQQWNHVGAPSERCLAAAWRLRWPSANAIHSTGSFPNKKYTGGCRYVFSASHSVCRSRYVLDEVKYVCNA